MCVQCPSPPLSWGVLIQWYGGMEWNGMSAPLLVLQGIQESLDSLNLRNGAWLRTWKINFNRMMIDSSLHSSLVPGLK